MELLMLHGIPAVAGVSDVAYTPVVGGVLMLVTSLLLLASLSSLSSL